MDQGVIEVTKRAYRYLYQKHCLVVLETEEDEEVDTRAERTLANYKAYNNWAEAWVNVKTTTLANAWNKVFSGTDVEVDFERFSPADFVNLLRLGGEKEVTEEGVVEWLDMDVEEQGFRHETDEEIIASVHGQNVTGDDDDDDDDDDDII